jgi:hemolysin activation/secretion protein
VGYVGAYIRNDISYNTSLSNGVSLSSFIGLDYGHVKKNFDTEGGGIVGASVGMNFYYEVHTLRINYDKAMKHTQDTRGYTDNKLGIYYEVRF